MTSPVFFSTGAAPVSGGSRNLVEFKAGKMELRDKMVHPIKRQGLVYLRQSQEDNLMHFCWKDRQSGVVEDDLILFPDDCEFKRVKECTTGRVYVLKMKSAKKTLFFWMQEPASESDEDYCKKINEMLTNPPRAGSDAGASSSDRDLQALLSQMSQEQISQLLTQNGVNLASIINAAGRSPSTNSGGSASSIAGSTNSSAPNSATQPTPASQLAAGHRDSSPNIDYRHLISEALMSGCNEEEAEALVQATLGRAVQGGSTSSQRNEDQPSVMVDLSHVINSDSLAHLLEDAEFLRQIENYLPAVTKNSDGVKKQAADTIRSSQFRSSLSQFCTALQSGQLGPLMSQFGLNQACVEAANLGNLEAFVRALESQTSFSSSTDSNAAAATTTTSSDRSADPKPDPSAGSQAKPPSSDQSDKK